MDGEECLIFRLLKCADSDVLSYYFLGGRSQLSVDGFRLILFQNQRMPRAVTWGFKNYLCVLSDDLKDLLCGFYRLVTLKESWVLDKMGRQTQLVQCVA